MPANDPGREEAVRYKKYVGDGVYADFDGYALVLTTEDGVSVQNRIVLEPRELAQLLTYVDWLKATLRQERLP